jgi:hypothetical protein
MEFGHSQRANSINSRQGNRGILGRGGGKMKVYKGIFYRVHWWIKGKPMHVGGVGKWMKDKKAVRAKRDMGNEKYPNIQQ